MSDSANSQSAPFTRAERIRDLLTIDADIANILRAASIALSDLTPSASTSIGSPAPSLESSKQEFESHTLAFYNQIQSVSARLRRQVYALEEAGIIAAEPEVQAAAPPIVAQPQLPPGRALRPGVAAAATAAQNTTEPAMPITNGGLGNLDIGWLNSRRDVVGKMKEAELWREARVLFERLQGQPQGNGPSTEGDVVMTEQEAEDGDEDENDDD